MSTDDLLDEATRLADSDWPPAALTIPVLRALVERVQQAEAERDSLRGIATSEVAAHETQVARIAVERDEWHQAALTATAGESRAERERDEARGKLDDVRARLTNERARAEHDCEPDGYIDWLDDTIAILDE